MSEQLTADTLLERGVRVRIDNVGLLRIFKRQTSFLIKQPPAGTLLYMARRACEMEINEDKLQENPIKESWNTVNTQMKNITYIITYAILRRRWKIRAFSWILSRYLLWRMTPEKILELSNVVLQVNNTHSFLHSIRFLAGQRLTSKMSLQNDGG